ncbi:MAG: hypothetical protein P8J46_03145 [Alphaproteobacteria bacterium]|nr:hypothetical protein [Alphaproteobacteria bacterium]
MNKIILISIFIFFAICSKSWAEESSAHILGNGKVIYSFTDPAGTSKDTYHIVYYKNNIYKCVVTYKRVLCSLMQDFTVDRSTM